MEALLSCLGATTSPDPALRQQAEAQLAASTTSSGFSIALIQIALTQTNDLGVRQSAAVYLKKVIKEQWDSGSQRYIGPGVSEEDRVAVRQIILSGLSDSSSKIRTAFAVAVSSIARSDWPDSWPGLLLGLLEMVKAQRTPEEVQGAIKCLSYFVADTGDDQTPLLTRALLPELLAIVSRGPAVAPTVHRHCLAIVYALLKTLSFMSGKYQRETRDLLAVHLEPWLPVFLHVLQSPLTLTDTGDWALKQEVLKIVTQLVQNFSKPLSAQLPILLGPCWRLNVEGADLYESSIVTRGEHPIAKEADSEGEELSLDTVLTQTLELLLSLLTNAKFSAMVQASLEDFFYTALRYMCLSPAQEQEWLDDTTQFIQDAEEYGVGLRSSGEMIFQEAFDQLGAAALPTFARAITRRLADVKAMEAAGDPHWWRVKEAVLLALGTVADQLQEALDDTDPRDLPALGAAGAPLALLAEAIRGDMGRGSPFLSGRILWLGARFVSECDEPAALALLQAAAAAICEPGVPMPVRICGIKTLGAVLDRLKYQAPFLKGPPLEALYTALTTMMNPDEDDVVCLLLDCLRALIKVDRHFLLQVEPAMTAGLLALWGQLYNDPLFMATLLDAVYEMAADPPVAAAMANTLAAQIRPIAVQGEGQLLGLLESGLDLLAAVARPGHRDACLVLCRSMLGPLLRLLTQSDDAPQLQSCCELLRLLVRGCGAEVAHMRPMEDVDTEALPLILHAVQRLLDPSLDASAATFLGALLCQLLATLPLQLAPHVPALLSAIVQRMFPEPAPVLTVGLVQGIARLVHLSSGPEEVLRLLEAIPAAPTRPVRPDAVSPEDTGAADASGLHRVLRLWTKYSGDFASPYNQTIATSALAMIVRASHPALDTIQVPGSRIVGAGEVGVQTRSQAKRTGGDRWTRVPLRVKIVLCLAEAVCDEIERRKNAAEEAMRAADSDSDSDSEADDFSDGEGLNVTGTSLGKGVGGRGARDVLDLLDESEMSVGPEELRGETIYLRGDGREPDELAGTDVLQMLRGVFQGLMGHAALRDAALAEMSVAQQRAVSQLMSG